MKKYCWNCYLIGPAKTGGNLKEEYHAKLDEVCGYCNQKEKTPLGKIINQLKKRYETTTNATS